MTNKDDNYNNNHNSKTTATVQLPWIIITRIISTAWSSHLMLPTTEHCSLEWNVSLELISKSMFKFVSRKMFTEVILQERTVFRVNGDMYLKVVDYVEALQHIINSHCVIKTLVIEGHGFDMLCDMHRNTITYSKCAPDTKYLKTFIESITNLTIHGKAYLNNNLILFPSLTTLRLSFQQEFDIVSMVSDELPLSTLQSLKKLDLMICHQRVLANLPDGLHLTLDIVIDDTDGSLNPNIMSLKRYYGARDVSHMNMITKLYIDERSYGISFDSMKRMSHLKHVRVDLSGRSVDYRAKGCGHDQCMSWTGDVHS
ncbi:hypothetical protein SAMD00019534_014340 [Acytostelium subglobosum LB1]|uniref:hypothetical protein n=1 Tax=Acytostelium subglobosum LB1 TaxID=1410327 RepID=UPI0006448DE7|nr:hypothetical protein SAMD00019534_014340 [Acytostelium subglobosum LB1]GAM18259.1 hypothetical protein SAMD00019534_014340 [Acytostelium subglobosum LB1]|eukprot:XP_012758855.1 hypothetical protein SAMD00019534_014340 [Acytostelium subglobosum LB1]